MRTLWRLILGILIGAMVGVFFIAAPAVFSHDAAIGSSMAGTIAGQMLRTLDWTILVGVGGLCVLEGVIRSRRESRERMMWMFGFLAAMLVLTIVEMVAITPAIHDLRTELAAQYGAIANAPEEARGRFGLLHAVSMLRGLGVLLCAIAAFVVESLAARTSLSAESPNRPE